MFAVDYRIRFNGNQILFETDDVIFVVEPFDSHYMKERRLTFLPQPNQDEERYFPQFDSQGGFYAIASTRIKNKQLQELHVPSSFSDNNRRLTIVSVSNFAEDSDNSIKYLSVGEGIKYIEFASVSSLPKIEDIMLPSTLEYIGATTFLDCFKLERILLQNKTTYIGSCCFLDCLNLKTITLPRSLKMIASSCFSGCVSLNSVVIPDNVELVCRQAFENCKNLKTVLLPKSVQHIDDTAFAGCHPDIMFFVYPGSYAHMWAVQHGYRVASAEL